MKMWKEKALTKRRIGFKSRFARHGSQDKGNNRRRAVGRFKFSAFIAEADKWIAEQMEG